MLVSLSDETPAGRVRRLRRQGMTEADAVTATALHAARDELDYFPRAHRRMILLLVAAFIALWLVVGLVVAES